MISALVANSNASISIEYIGNEGTPIIIIDDWLEDASKLKKYPPQGFNEWKTPSTLYPGIWSEVPLAYMSVLLATLKPLAESVFKIPFNPVQATSFFGVMTKSPEELSLFQKAPHVDTLYIPQLATVHYLCDESFSGTSFYRHRKTGFETLALKQWPAYRKILEQELSEGAALMGYIDDSDAYFERIKECKVKFNRLLIYPSQVLHCGLLNRSFVAEGGIDSSRLTINSFVGYYVIGS